MAMPSKTEQIIYPEAVSGLTLRDSGQAQQVVPLMQCLLSTAHHHVHQMFQWNLNSVLLITAVLLSSRKNGKQGSDMNQLKDKKFLFLLHRCTSSNENISRGLGIHFQSEPAFSAVFPKYCNIAILHREILRCSEIILPNPH